MLVSKSVNPMLARGFDERSFQAKLTHILQAQDFLAATVVKIEEGVRLIAALCVFLGKSSSMLWEVLAYDIDHIAVAECSSNAEEPLVGSLFDLHCFDVSICHVSDVNPDVHTSFRDFVGVLALALNQVSHSLVRSVESIE